MTEDLPILTVNTGSSSVRLAAFRPSAGERMEALAAQRYEPDQREPAEILRHFFGEHGLAGISLVAHRVVHGGEKLQQACLLDAGVEAEIEKLAPLAPLHNPVALRWIRACRATLAPSTKQVAVFDTAFYADLPHVARIYALPQAWVARHHLQRYGFHGLAHADMWRRWQARREKSGDRGRVISLQLGAGCSITATDRGVAKDTSMGFSPLEGLVMATRSGDIDPGLITFLQRQEDLSPQATDRMLNDASGLLGVSGLSGDMRELLASDSARARLAVDLYCYRARKYIGAYIAVLGGVDAILFGGGVGENAPEIRARILDGMEWSGVRLDESANVAARGEESRISHGDSRVEVWVIPVDEAQLLAEEAMTVITGKGGIQ